MSSAGSALPVRVARLVGRATPVRGRTAKVKVPNCRLEQEMQLKWPKLLLKLKPPKSAPKSQMKSTSKPLPKILSASLSLLCYAAVEGLGQATGSVDPDHLFNKSLRTKGDLRVTKEGLKPHDTLSANDRAAFVSLERK